MYLLLQFVLNWDIVEAIALRGGWLLFSSLTKRPISVCSGNSGLLMMDPKMRVNVIPGPKARCALFFSDCTLFSVALFSTGGLRGTACSPVRFGQEEGGEPPETSVRLHLRGLCCERGIGSFACKSLLGALRSPLDTGAWERCCLIHTRPAETLLFKRVSD